MSAIPPLRIGNMLTASDYFRRSPSRLSGPAEHKEWQHFILHTQDVHLLINFSLVDDAHARERRQAEIGRLIVLARSSEWDGDVDTFETVDVDVSAGRIEAQMGESSMRFENDRYYLRVVLRNRPITAELEMTPTIVPTMSSNQPLSRTRNISWLFVPRLVCRGVVTVGDRRIEVENAPGYHDHNWGHFRWDDDFSWEWGSALPLDPANPWSLVYMRMCDRGRTMCRSQALYIGYGEQQLRFYRDQDIRITLYGRFAQDRCLKVPRVMAMLSPGTAKDLPAELVVAAGAGGGEVEMRFRLEDVAQLVLPSETRLDGVTTINEVSGTVTMRGRIKGRTVEMDGPGVFEFIRD